MACSRVFEKVRQYFGAQSESIPMSFVLGFYVSLVVKRWWEQYKLLPWPDTLALFISAGIPGAVSKVNTVQYYSPGPGRPARPCGPAAPAAPRALRPRPVAAARAPLRDTNLTLLALFCSKASYLFIYLLLLEANGFIAELTVFTSLLYSVS